MDDYDVGYKKPPVASRFKKGQSGNPKGRPKRPKSNAARISELLNRKIRVKDGNKHRKVTVLEGVMMAQISRALGGDRLAAQWLYSLQSKPQSVEEMIEAGMPIVIELDMGAPPGRIGG